MSDAPLTHLDLDQAGIFARLEAGHELVTGNNRLARSLRNRYAQFRKDRGDTRWETPRIWSWDAWLDSAWELASLAGATGTRGRVPGPRQLLRLWEQVLAENASHDGALLSGSLAADLTDARTLVREWQLDLGQPAWQGDYNENHAAFVRWNRAFEAHCDQGDWIPPEDRPAILRATLENGEIRIRGPLDFIGFDEFSPARRRLLTTLAENGGETAMLAIEPHPQDARRSTATDKDDETLRMAKWARYWLEREPGSRIGIIVHDLPGERAAIERALGEALAPGRTAGPGSNRPWNMSAGLSLARYPMVEAALDWLDLAKPGLDIGLVSRVLRSPWIRGGDSERIPRALLERRLRKKYPRQLRPGDVLYRATERDAPAPEGEADPEAQTSAKPWNCPVLTEMLGRLGQHARGDAERLPPSGWAERIDASLRAAGWPQAAESTAAEEGDDWQTLQAWRECLLELASLDAVETAWRRSEAISQLREICRDRIFQPRSAEAPIQVLGLYEAHSLEFDHVWVSGLQHENWPPAARPNPFIPGQAQVEMAMPHSSPQRELEVARTITCRLLQSSNDCLFSHAGQADGEEVLPSPLLAELEEISGDAIPGSNARTWTQSMLDDPGPDKVPAVGPGPAVIHDEREKGARGGSAILKHQALCPFRAFAANRLLAEALEAPSAGVSPALHGSLLHRVLEAFWRDIQGHAELRALADDVLRSRVEEHVQATLEDEPGLRFRSALRHIEAARLCRHVLAYLELEKEREPFSVAGREMVLTPEIEGLPIRLQIDRVDRLASGEEVIIDYKTGKVQPGKWFSERPQDPQLPLYATSVAETPAAVAFAVIREDGCGFKGISRREGILPGLPPKRTKATEHLVQAGEDMPETIRAWRETLHRLMAEFLAGEAAVDPRDGRRTCRETWCNFQALCRIDELDPAHAPDEGDADE